MTRRFLMPLIAAAIALSPISAAPARAADGEDVAKAILGATALFVIINELDDRKKDKRSEVRRGEDFMRHRQAAPEIPAECIRRIDTPNGRGRVVSERCMRREGIHRLPERCEMSVRGRHDVYGLRCLERAGYRVEDRRAYQRR